MAKGAAVQDAGEERKRRGKEMEKVQPSETHRRERREAGQKHDTVLCFWLSAGLLVHLWRQ